MKRRVGCLILALLFALLFIFWGMLCRLTLPISPEGPATQPVPASRGVGPGIHGNFAPGVPPATGVDPQEELWQPG